MPFNTRKGGTAAQRLADEFLSTGRSLYKEMIAKTVANDGEVAVCYNNDGRASEFEYGTNVVEMPPCGTEHNRAVIVHTQPAYIEQKGYDVSRHSGPDIVSVYTDSDKLRGSIVFTFEEVKGSGTDTVYAVDGEAMVLPEPESETGTRFREILGATMENPRNPQPMQVGVEEGRRMHDFLKARGYITEFTDTVTLPGPRPNISR